MRIQSWLVLAMMLAGCPTLDMPDGGSEDGEGGDADCADGGVCGDRDGDSRFPGSGSGGGAGDDEGPRDGSDQIVGIDGGTGSGDEPSHSGDGVVGSASDFEAAVTALNTALCECLPSQSYDQCTESTAEQRACEFRAAEANSDVGGEWLGCVAGLAREQAECVRAAACDDQALMGCPIFAAAGSNPYASCGEPPAVLDEAVSACSADEAFLCANGVEIPADLVCDGVQHCADNSDEACDSGGGSDAFVCGDGEQIPAEWECDAEADCTDGSDEANCGDAVFTCNNGDGIPSEWVCDGVADCTDSSDEASCDSSI